MAKKLGAIFSIFPQVIGITKARNEFLSIIKEVAETDESFIVTKNDRPQAVILSWEEYEELIEILEDLANPELKKRIAEARANFERTGGIAFREYDQARPK